MSPYRIGNDAMMSGIRRSKRPELGPQLVPDEAANRMRRAELIGSLPDRMDAGVIEDFGAERVLWAGSPPPAPHVALRAAVLLVGLGLLSLFL